MNPEIFKTVTPTLSFSHRPNVQEGVLGALQALENLSLDAKTPHQQDGLTFTTKFEPVTTLNGLILTVSVKSEKGAELSGPIELKYATDLKDMKMMSNGFQSWSQAREFDSKSRIQKIQSTIAWYTQFHLQGDYSFFEHSGDKGFIHSSSYTHFRDVKNNVTFLGSLAEESGYTYFKSDFNANALTIYKDATGKVLQPNQEIEIIKVLVLHGKDQERAFWDTYSSYFKDERTISGNENPKRHVSGWTSWYYHYDHVTEEIVHKNLDAIVHYKYPIDIFQIDDGYQLAIGDWLEVNNKFPGGMKELAAKIKSHGIMAGLWLAPYAVGFNSRIVKDHPEWILKEEHDSSKMVVAGPNWGGFYALDLYNDGARDYIRHVFDVVLNKWGFDMVKLDFLFAAAMIPQRGKSRGEIMTDAMEFLREVVGPNKIILGCGVPLGPSWRKVDYCRIGSDVAPWWEDTKLRLLHVRERVSTVNSLHSTLNRWGMSDSMFGNDPDVMILRSKNNKLKPDEKYTLCVLNNVLGALVFISDDVSEYTEEEHMLYAATFPKVQAKVNTVIEIRDEVYFVQFKATNAQGQEHFYTTYSNLSGDKETIYLPEATKDTHVLFATDNDLHTNKPDKKQALFYLPSAPVQLKGRESKTFLHIPAPGSGDVHLLGSTGHIVPGTELTNITRQDNDIKVDFVANRARASKVFVGLDDCRRKPEGSFTVNGKPAVWDIFNVSGSESGAKVYAAVVE
ncbi:hypothetical protein INT44_006052, partial [Umbelopsis vinacea]